MSTAWQGPDPLAPDGVPEDLRAELTTRFGKALADAGCRRATKPGAMRFPHPAWARWLVETAGGSTRVAGPRAKRQLVVALRIRAGMDSPGRAPRDLTADDLAHIERVARELLPTPF